MVTEAGTQIQIVSDLHLENPAAYDVFEIPPTALHLALIGDIGHAKDEGLYEFLRKQLRNFRTVFFLLGNHEPYHSSWDSARSRLYDFQKAMDEECQSVKGLGRFVFLNRRRFDLSPKVTVLGCTLYSRVDPEQTDYVSFGLNDFYHIKDWTVEDHTDAYTTDLTWLNEQVSTLAATQPDRHIIILTHHSPTMDPCSIDPNHASSKISSGFMTDMSAEDCWINANVKVWAFGHTHFNCDFIDGKTGKRIVSNQRGYYFSQAKGFEVQKVIYLEDA